MKFCNAGVEDRSSDLLYLPYLREQKDVATIHVKYSRDSQLEKLTHYHHSIKSNIWEKKLTSIL